MTIQRLSLVQASALLGSDALLVRPRYKGGSLVLTALLLLGALVLLALPFLPFFVEIDGTIPFAPAWFMAFLLGAICYSNLCAWRKYAAPEYWLMAVSNWGYLLRLNSFLLPEKPILAISRDEVAFIQPRSGWESTPARDTLNYRHALDLRLSDRLPQGLMEAMASDCRQRLIQLSLNLIPAAQWDRLAFAAKGGYGAFCSLHVRDEGRAIRYKLSYTELTWQGLLGKLAGFGEVRPPASLNEGK